MNSRGRILLIGGLGGALIGLAGAWLYLQSAQRDGKPDLTLPTPADMARLGLSIVGVLRQIAVLGRIL
jgi:hypothetical protein